MSAKKILMLVGDFVEDSDYTGPVEQAMMDSLSNDIESLLDTLSDKEADELVARVARVINNA